MTPDARPLSLLCQLEGKTFGQHLPSLSFLVWEVGRAGLTVGILASSFLVPGAGWRKGWRRMLEGLQEAVV